MKEYIITINNRSHSVIVKKIQTNTAIIEVNGKDYQVGIERKRKRQVEPLDIKPTKIIEKVAAPAAPAPKRTSVPITGNDLIAPLPGLILKILVKEGDSIKSNQTVIKMEAMKMENDIKSDKGGVVKKIMVKEGEAVLENTVLIRLETA